MRLLIFILLLVSMSVHVVAQNVTDVADDKDALAPHGASQIGVRILTCLLPYLPLGLTALHKGHLHHRETAMAIAGGAFVSFGWSVFMSEMQRSSETWEEGAMATAMASIPAGIIYVISFLKTMDRVGILGRS